MDKITIKIPPTIPSDQTWSIPQIESEADSDTSEVEHLLTDHVPSLYIKPQNRPFKDIIFIFLYGAFFLTFIVLGFIEICTRPDVTLSKSLFGWIWNQLGLFIGLILTSIIASLGWLYLVTTFSNIVIIITGLMLPLAFFGMFLGICIKFLATPTLPNEIIEFKTLASVAFIGIIGGCYSLYKVYKSKHMVTTMTMVIQIATQVLKSNPNLFLLSAGLTLVQFLFSLFWLWIFSHVFTHGQIISKDGILSIVLNPFSNFTVIYFILMYFWTSALLKNIEKTTVASVVGEWYFERFETPITSDETWFHFKYVSTRSFGSIAFASLVIGMVQSVQFIIHKINEYSPQKLTQQRFVRFTIDTITRFIDNFTSYQIVHVGLTGESFLVSGYQSTRLFHRNLVLGLLTASLSRLISFMGKFLVSSVIGYIFFWNSQGMATGYEWLTFFVGTMIPYYVLGIFSHVFETTYLFW